MTTIGTSGGCGEKRADSRAISRCATRALVITGISPQNNPTDGPSLAAKESSRMDLKGLVRTIPDYPKPGIMFRDVTTLMADAQGFKAAIGRLAEPYRSEPIDVVAGIEARGFILAGAIADRLGTGFVPIRKKGKLPWRTIGQEYALEYGTDVVEMHEDALARGRRVLLVDDLIATGGTATAGAALIRRLGGEIVGAAFVIDLPDLGGAARLKSDGIAVHTLMAFEGH